MKHMKCEKEFVFFCVYYDDTCVFITFSLNKIVIPSLSLLCVLVDSRKSKQQLETVHSFWPYTILLYR